MARTNKHKPGKAAAQAKSVVASSPVNQQQQSATSKSFGSAASIEPLDAPLLVLHVIRILALYLYVLLSRLQQRDGLQLHEIFFPETKAVELLVESTASEIELQIHAAVLACVQCEIDSNQFDGLIQEKTVFAAIKRIFRQQNVKPKTQCRLLVRLLNSFLIQLAHAPIVRCDAMGMLASTLEYLAKGPSQSKNEPVAVSLLYPLVNAIDSLSIEQRECLDALTTLWRWLEVCDPSKMLLDHIIHRQHAVIFCLEQSAKPASASSTAATAAELGACFVHTLVHHADHIFRHDLDFTDPHDLLSSDSEPDDSSCLLAPREEPSTPPPNRTAAPSFSPSKMKKQPKKTPQPKPVSDAPEVDDEPVVLDANEPMPANMMRVGIAAAAGTLAAALCVIFT